MFKLHTYLVCINMLLTTLELLFYFYHQLNNTVCSDFTILYYICTHVKMLQYLY